MSSVIKSPLAKTILGFDFGTLRIGIAVGQTFTETSTPLAPITARDGIPDWDALGKIILEWQPDLFVVGKPLNMDGSESDMSRRASKFGNRLHGRFHKPIIMVDERLSTREAKEIYLSQGGTADFKKNAVDSIAASLILETWFSQQES